MATARSASGIPNRGHRYKITMPLKPTSYEAAKLAAARYAENRRAKLATKPAKIVPFRPNSLSKGRKVAKSGVSTDRGSQPEQAPGQIRRGKRGFKRGVRIDAADKYFSLFIRYRDNWTCQRCFRKFEVGSQGLHNSHHFGRARENTRFDPTNCDALDHGCHAFFTANPVDHCAWKLARIGQREYDKLTIRANTHRPKDRKLQALIAKKLYEDEKKRFEAEVLNKQ